MMTEMKGKQVTLNLCKRRQAEMRAAQKANKIKGQKESDQSLKSNGCPDVDLDSRMESKSLNFSWKEKWKSRRVRNT